MDRNLALEFVRVTEAAAISCSKLMGKGDKIKADAAAVKAMRERFNYINFTGEVVIGEGEKDKAPMLYTGEKLGNHSGLEVDIAVDPLECTTNLAMGKPNAISVLAAGPKGTLLRAPGTYMDQIAVGPLAKDAIDITLPIDENIKNVASALDKEINELTVCLLDRPRHQQLIKQIRDAGARIRLIDHGTISAGISTCLDDNAIDMMVGIGGAPEAVITAAALKCYHGDIQAILKPHNEKTKQEALDMGFTDLDRVFKIDDLAKGNELMFTATGISDGPLLKGVRWLSKHKILTYSLVTRAKTGTIRYIKAIHNCKDNC